MPIVQSPIFRVGDENLQALQQLGQGGGQLLGALLDFYRRQGGGTYAEPGFKGIGPQQQVPAGASSLDMARQSAMGQGTFQPNRLGFLGPIQPNAGAIERQLLPLQLQQAQGDIAYKQAQTRSLSPEFQANVLRQYQGLPPISSEQGTPQPDFTSALQSLRQQSESGDEQAVQRLRLILRLLRESHATD